MKLHRKVNELDNVLSDQIKDKWKQQEKLQHQIDQIKEALSNVAYKLTKELDQLKKRLDEMENKS